MQVYVANTTMQNGVLNCRIPEMNGVISLPVPAGRQTRVSENWNMPQFEAMMRHMGKYGMVTVEEAKSGRKTSHPTIWIASLEKPVPQELIARTMAGNREHVAKVGEETRRQAALATAHNMREMAHTPNAAKDIELSLEEIGRGPEDQSDSLIGHGIHVTSDPGAAPGLDERASGRAGAGRKAAGKRNK